MNTKKKTPDERRGELTWKQWPLQEASQGWSEEQWDKHDAKVEAERKAEAQREAEEEARHRPAAMERAGWPLRAIESAQAADLDKPAVARVLEWKTSAESILVLSGPPGTGKTTAAARWALAQRRAPVFLRATAFASSSRYDQEQRSEWLKASALVLDDLGSEYNDTKGNFLVDLDELIDTFYGDKRPLLITTNCGSEDFKTRYGRRVVDRLRECGTWYSVSGDSMRKKPE